MNAQATSPIRFELQHASISSPGSNAVGRVARGQDLSIEFAAKLTKGFVGKDATLKAYVSQNDKDLLDFSYDFC